MVPGAKVRDRTPRVSRVRRIRDWIYVDLLVLLQNDQEYS